MKNWDNLRIFLTVARAGQFLSAGKTLKLDNGTIARRISALEAETNVQLFHRSTSGVSLTAAGRELLIHAELMEINAGEAIAELSNNSSIIAGTVRIAAPEGFASYFLIPALAKFTRLYPKIIVQLVPQARSFSLARREADIAIALDRPNRGRVTAMKLSDYQLGLYASAQYLTEHGAIEQESDLADRTIVTYVDDLIYSPSLDSHLLVFNHCKNRFECVSAVAQLHAIRSGIGIGMVHEFIARQFPDLVPVVPRFRAKRTYWLVTHIDQRSLRHVDLAYRFIEATTHEAGSLFFCPDAAER